MVPRGMKKGQETMANYYGVARTNYFQVQDVEAFDRFCEKWGVTKLVADDPALVGFMCDEHEHGFPCSYTGPDGEREDGDIASDLAPLLADGHVAIGVETGHEKVRYVVGYAWAVNNRLETRRIDLNDIDTLARELGEHVTAPCY